MTNEKPIVVDDILKHHGILGMKWGIRRFQDYPKGSGGPKGKFVKEKVATNTTKKKSTRNDREERTKLKGKLKSNKPKAPSAKTMTDDELRQQLNRLQMERQYADLTKQSTSPGQKFVSDILVNAAKQTATSYITQGIKKVVTK